MTDKDFEEFDAIRRSLTENRDPVGAMVEAALLGESDRLTSIVYHAAIPKVINADILVKLSDSPISPAEANRDLERIKEWGFVQELNRGAFLYRPEIRQYLYNQLKEDDPDRFLLLNQRAYEFFSSRLREGFEEEHVSLNLSDEQFDALRESIYHLIQFEPQRGFNLFRKMYLSAMELHLIEHTRTLTKFIKQLDPTSFSTIQRLELTYVDALHDQLDGKIESAEAKFKDVISQAPPSALQAQALTKLGKLYYTRKQFKAAIKSFEDAQKIWMSLNSPSESAALWNNIGNAHLEQQEYRQAEKAFQNALTQLEKAGASLELAKVFNNFGNLYRKQEDWGKARQYYERSLDIKNRLGDQYGAATTRLNVGRLYQRLGQVAPNNKRAMEHYEKAKLNYSWSLNVFHQFGAHSYQARTLFSFAQLHELEGRTEEARYAYNEAISIFSSLGMSREVELASKKVNRLGS